MKDSCINCNSIIHVAVVDDDEEITSVVFGYEMPEDEEDFNTMAEDPFAWESDFEVLATVQNI